jgi:hypothetical protein
MAVLATITPPNQAATPAPVVPDPSQVSGDYAAMAPFWDQVEAILGGSLSVRTGREIYLPQFPNEAQADYDYRVANAKFTNIYADIATSLAAKPFSEECTVDDTASPKITVLAEDIDGRGNNLHVFASDLFFNGINYALGWILVDFTQARLPPGQRTLTINQEAEQGLRPYWVQVPAKRMLAVYTMVVGGKEEFVHCRIQENSTERFGFEEICVEQIRVFNRVPIYEVLPEDAGREPQVIGLEPATYDLWRKGREGKWGIVHSGEVTIGIIPIVPFITGRRKGSSWQFVPPMQGAADLQIEHYQQETNLKAIKEQAAFPMLAGNGVTPAKGADNKPLAVPVGPKSVLYAPMHPDTGQHGEWKFIEPTAESLKFLAADVKATEEQLRELGRQPLTATAGITVVVAGLASQKASSAVQAWAIALKDALEQAFKITERWINESTETIVNVFTDFGIDPNDDKGVDALNSGRKNGDISRPTWWAEMSRRNILGPDFDPKKEEELLQSELDDQVQQDDIAAARMIDLKATPPGAPTPSPPPAPPAGA